MFLVEFLNKHHVSNHGFTKEFKKCPSLANYLEHVPTFSNHYLSQLAQEHQRALFQTMHWVVDEYTSTLEQRSYDLSAKFQFWGTLETNIHFDIVLQALKFQFTKIGHPLSRASFAALKLYEMLSPLAAKIYLKSNTTLGHPAVYIIMDKTWWIYDPNLNPELIFNNKDYRNEVIKLLPKVPSNHPQLNIQIKPETWLLFQKKLPQLENLLKQKFDDQPNQFLPDEKLLDESIHLLQKRIF